MITFDIAPGQDSLPGNASSPLSLVSELYIFNESRLSFIKIKYLLFTHEQLPAQKTILPGARAHRNRSCLNRHMNWSFILVMPLPALIMAVTVSFSRPVTPVSAITIFM